MPSPSGGTSSKDPVVARPDDGVVDGRVEAAGGADPRSDSELDDPAEIGPRVQRTATVELTELGALAETREDLLEAVELGLGTVELGRRARGIDEQLDLGPHRSKGPVLDHDVLVIVNGGRLTTRTDGAALTAD